MTADGLSIKRRFRRLVTFLKSRWLSFPLVVCITLGILWFILGRAPQLLQILYGNQPKELDRSIVIELASAVFSALALTGVIAALWLQHEELKEARQDALDSSRLVFKQNFESTFFQMLGMLDQIRLDVTAQDFSALGGPAKQLTGRVAIRELARRLKERLTDIPPERLESTYLDFYYDVLADTFGQYFRTVYRTLKFVKLSSIDDKEFYTGLLRGQMSNSELFMLFYNCISSLGSERAKPLIEEFNMFDNFPVSELVDKEHHRPLVKSTFAKERP